MRERCMILFHFAGPLSILHFFDLSQSSGLLQQKSKWTNYFLKKYVAEMFEIGHMYFPKLGQHPITKRNRGGTCLVVRLNLHTSIWICFFHFEVYQGFFRNYFKELFCFFHPTQTHPLSFFFVYCWFAKKKLNNQAHSHCRIWILCYWKIYTTLFVVKMTRCMILTFLCD